MELFSFKSPINCIVVSLLVYIIFELYIQSADSLQLEKSTENQNDSNFEDDNSINGYSPELHSQILRKNEDWMNVTMSQGSHLLLRNQSYEINCEASGKPAPEIHWIRGTESQKEINELQRKLRIRHFRFENEPNMAKIMSKYIINCASEADAGSIHCIAISGHLLKKKSAVIEIVGPSLHEMCNMEQSPVITYFRSMFLSIQGSTIILPCDTLGNPKPQTFWQTSNDDGKIDITSNSHIKILKNGGLLIKSLKWSDLGEYICTANSTLGEVQMTTFVYPLKSPNQGH